MFLTGRKPLRSRAARRRRLRPSRRFLSTTKPIEQVDGAVRVACIAGIVGVTMQIVDPARCSFPAKQIHHLLPVGRVEISSGLVGEKNGRVSSQGSGCHATRCCWPPESCKKDSASGDGSCRRAPALRGRVSCAQPRACRDRSKAIPRSRIHGEIADEIECLEDEPDLAVPDARNRSAILRRCTWAGC